MKRKLYLDIAVFIVILGGFGAFIFMQQHAPATETQTQETVDAPAAGCCGAAKVEGETAGGCCGTPASETAQSDEVEQQVKPSGTPKTDKTSPKTPQTDDADAGGCGCGS
ncbi:hypothetical protein C6501_10080 [Candidatus Poribacteria bacterium]|nr:MAG: hypothetical protein C6501_10080 [Candidatus Poribacteria bacterium]